MMNSTARKAAEEKIDERAGCGLSVLFQEESTEDEREDAERNVDEEDPPPGQLVDQQTAHDRS
jgi:hypothetical protein